MLGVANGYMLIKRVTPFNAQDLKVAGDAVSLINNYFDPIELIVLVIGIVAVVLWVVSMCAGADNMKAKCIVLQLL